MLVLCHDCVLHTCACTLTFPSSCLPTVMASVLQGTTQGQPSSTPALGMNTSSNITSYVATLIVSKRCNVHIHTVGTTAKETRDGVHKAAPKAVATKTSAAHKAQRDMPEEPSGSQRKYSPQPAPPTSLRNNQEGEFHGTSSIVYDTPLHGNFLVTQSICDETGHVIPSSTSGPVPTLPLHCFTLHTPLTSTPCSFFHSSNTGEDKSTSSKGTGQEEHDGSATGGFKPSRATRSLREHRGDRRQPEHDHLSERGRVQVSKHTL